MENECKIRCRPDYFGAPGMGKTDSSSEVYIFYENYTLRTAVITLSLFSAL